MPAWLGGTIGSALLVVAWEILALTVFHKVGSASPTPTAIVAKTDPTTGRALRPNIARPSGGGHRLRGANVLAIVARRSRSCRCRSSSGRCCASRSRATACRSSPSARSSSSSSTATRQGRLAALSVFFTTLIGCSSGCVSADRTSLEVVQAYGGGSWTQLRKVRLAGRLPSMFAGLRIAAPAAMLGAIIGEYIGRQDRGLGIVMIDAQGASRSTAPGASRCSPPASPASPTPSPVCSAGWRPRGRRVTEPHGRPP